MPLVDYLRSNWKREFGWHRVDERRARGLPSMATAQQSFEGWERQMVVYESMLLSAVETGHVPGHASVGCREECYRFLAHAWGRKRNFHNDIVKQVFSRRGGMERKVRSDAGVERKMRSDADDM